MNTTSNTPSLRRVHALLTAQTIIILLLSLNRLGPWTTGYVASNEFLRWVDLHNMLTLPLASLVAFWLLKTHLPTLSDRPERRDRVTTAIALAIVVGVYLLGAGYGDHEITNYLHLRFAETQGAGADAIGGAGRDALARIIVFNDDSFSHWVFFIGYSVMNGALMAWQVAYPFRAPLTRRDAWLIAANGLFIALGIFANLAFETIGLDLYVVAGLAALSAYLLWRHRGQPILVYSAVAYVGGLAATGLYTLFVR